VRSIIYFFATSINPSQTWSLFLDVNGLAVKSGDLFIRGTKLSCVLSAAGRKQSRRQRWFFSFFFFFLPPLFLSFSSSSCYVFVAAALHLKSPQDYRYLSHGCIKIEGKDDTKDFKNLHVRQISSFIPRRPHFSPFPSLSLNWTFRWHWQSWGCRRKRWLRCFQFCQPSCFLEMWNSILWWTQTQGLILSVCRGPKEMMVRIIFRFNNTLKNLLSICIFPPWNLVFAKVAQLLQTDVDDIALALTSKTTLTRGEMYNTPLTLQKVLFSVIHFPLRID